MIGFCLLLVAGCSQQSSKDWHDTLEAAIESGLQQEDAGRESLLSMEEFEGESFVFYEYMGGLGVANIIESENGYAWERTSPYMGFEVTGDLPYTTSGFDIETGSGLEVSVLVGQAYDPSIQEMELVGTGPTRNLPVLGENNFFYALHEVPFGTVSVSPIE